MTAESEHSKNELIPGPDAGLILFSKEYDILLVRDHRNLLKDLMSKNEVVRNLKDIPDLDSRDKIIGLAKAVFSDIHAEETQSELNGYVTITAIPLKDSENIVQNGILLLTQDPVSDIESETILKQEKEYAEEANKLQSDFIASVSHEIRTPLNAILGFTEQLTKTKLNEKQKDYLQIIDNSALHLLDLVNGILTFSKLESGEMHLDEIDFNLKSLVDNVYHTFKTRAEKKQINFWYQFDDKLDMIYLGDAFRLKQILMNLISNAIKFTEVGFVELNIIHIEGDDNHTWIEFMIADSGLGISSDKMKDIFVEFRQANAGITGKHGGTGLGLTICKRLTRMMNGTISATSTKGKGSEFKVRIPLKRSQAISVEEDHIAINREVLSGIKALIVDDDAMNRLLGKIILEDLNMEVDLTTNGRNAIRMVKENDYDVILLDIHMPDISGIDVARNVREVQQKHKVKIVAVTADVIREDFEEYFREGINDFLIKPYHEINLYNKLCKVLELKHQQVLLDKTEIILHELKAAPLYNLFELRKITKGNQDFFRDMLETYINNSKEGLKVLKSASNDQNWELVGETAHKLLPSYKHIDIKSAVSDLIDLKRISFNKPEANQILSLISQIEETTNEVIESLKTEKP